MELQITSESFADRSPIPQRFTGEGADISPQLSWSNVPSAAKQLVLICDDPNAPGIDPFVHWVLYNIPAEKSALDEGASEDIGTHGRNSFGRQRYNGPMPPPGHGVHNYEFKLYAIDKKLELPPGLTKEEVLKAIEGKILAEAEIDGTYLR